MCTLLASFCAVFHIECIAGYLEGPMASSILSGDAEENAVKRLSEHESENNKSLSWLFDSM